MRSLLRFSREYKNGCHKIMGKILRNYFNQCSETNDLLCESPSREQCIVDILTNVFGATCTRNSNEDIVNLERSKYRRVESVLVFVPKKDI